MKHDPEIWQDLLVCEREKSGTFQQYLNQAFSDFGAADNMLCAIQHANYT